MERSHIALIVTGALAAIGLGALTLTRDTAPEPPEFYTEQAKAGDSLIEMGKAKGLTTDDELKAFIAFQQDWMEPLATERCAKLDAKFVAGTLSVEAFTKSGKPLGAIEVKRTGEYCNKGQTVSTLNEPWWSEVLREGDPVRYDCTVPTFADDPNCTPQPIASR